MRNYRVLDSQSNGHRRIAPTVTGLALLNDPLLNRDTAFTMDERKGLDLVGLLPSAVMTLDEQVKRAYVQYQLQPTDLDIRALEDRKSTRLNSSHQIISYAVFCLKKKKNKH